MFKDTSAIFIEPIAGRRDAVCLIWNRNPSRVDVRATFKQLTDLMDAAPGPLHLIVDLRTNPIFPVAATIIEAQNGPLRHPNLGYRLVIGHSRVAHAMARVINLLVKDERMHWFDTVDEALLALDTLVAVSQISPSGASQYLPPPRSRRK